MKCSIIIRKSYKRLGTVQASAAGAVERKNCSLPRQGDDGPGTVPGKRYPREAERVFIACGYTEFRLGIDGLTALVKRQFAWDSFENCLFLFCGRKRDRIKALYWESNGFFLLYKRLESGRFQWPRKESEARAPTMQQYRWLMEGSSIDRKNFLFANTPWGAAGSAVIFSLIRTSMEYGLDPYKYLSHVFHRAVQADLSKPDVLAALLPENAPLECRSSAPK